MGVRQRSHYELALNEPTDEPYEDRTYRAVDPEGHRWTFATRVESSA